MKNIYSFMRSMLLTVVLLFPIVLYSQIPANFMVWKYSAGRINSSALVVDNALYVGDMNGKFAKLDAATGAEIWSYKATDYIASHAAYKDGVVVFEAGDRLYGLNAENGNLLWTFRSTTKTSTVGYDTGWHHSSPAIEGNTAYFGDEWGYMNGVNLTTGKLDFQYHIAYKYDTLTDYTIHTMPVIKDSIIYFGDYQGKVYAISLRDSSEKWITQMETPRWDGSIVSEMVIDNGVLYCGRYTNAFIPLDLETGKPLWKFSDNDTFLPSTPVFYKDQVIIGTTISSNHIYSLNKSTGAKNWELSVKGIFFVKPIIIQDSILVMNSTDPFSDKWGVIYLINLEKGTIIDDIYMENAPETSPVSTNGMVIIGGQDGLYAFNYKPALADHGPSKISFDATAVYDTITTAQAVDHSFSLINNSDFCDVITIGSEITGNSSTSAISCVGKTNYNFRPTQELKVTLKAKAGKLTAGDYKVVITIRTSRQEKDPLYTKTVFIRVDEAVGIGYIKSDKQWKASPNPFINSVSFTSSYENKEASSIEIFTVEGKRVYFNKAIRNNRLEWNCTNEKENQLNEGIYFYKITTGKNVSNGKILKIN